MAEVVWAADREALSLRLNPRQVSDIFRMYLQDVSSHVEVFALSRRLRAF